MLARSARFDQAITGAHTLGVQADILVMGLPAATNIEISGGSISFDRSQLTLRQCRIEVADPTLAPHSSSDLLTPYGNEVQLYRGVTYPDGGTELLPAGVFGIFEVPSLTPFGGLAVTGNDRMKRVAEVDFPFARTMFETSVVGAIQTLLAEAVPWAPFHVDPRIIDVHIPLITWSSGRAQAISDLATSVGGWVYAGARGEFVLAPVPNPASSPVATFQGGANGTVIVGTAQRTFTRDGTFNGVVVRGTGVASAVSDLVYDNNPVSPTYWLGNFGQVVRSIQLASIVSKEQATGAARGILLDQLGTAKSVSFSTVPNPAIEPGDVIEVYYGDGPPELHVLDAGTLPLDAATAATTVSTRTVSYL